MEGSEKMTTVPAKSPEKQLDSNAEGSCSSPFTSSLFPPIKSALLPTLYNHHTRKMSVGRPIQTVPCANENRHQEVSGLGEPFPSPKARWANAAMDAFIDKSTKAATPPASPSKNSISVQVIIDVIQWTFLSISNFFCLDFDRLKSACSRTRKKRRSRWPLFRLVSHNSDKFSMSK